MGAEDAEEGCDKRDTCARAKGHGRGCAHEVGKGQRGVRHRAPGLQTQHVCLGQSHVLPKRARASRGTKMCMCAPTTGKPRTTRPNQTMASRDRRLRVPGHKCGWCHAPDGRPRPGLAAPRAAAAGARRRRTVRWRLMFSAVFPLPAWV